VQLKILSGPGSPAIINSSGEVPALQLMYKGNLSIGGANITDSGQYLVTFAATGHGTSGTGIYKSPEYQRGEGIINSSDGERAHYIFQAIGYAANNGTRHIYNGVLVFIDAPSVGKLAFLNTPSNLFRIHFELNADGGGIIRVGKFRAFT
jgi:hypothetical protein